MLSGPQIQKTDTEGTSPPNQNKCLFPHLSIPTFVEIGFWQNWGTYSSAVFSLMFFTGHGSFYGSFCLFFGRSKNFFSIFEGGLIAGNHPTGTLALRWGICFAAVRRFSFEFQFVPFKFWSAYYWGK